MGFQEDGSKANTFVSIRRDNPTSRLQLKHFAPDSKTSVAPARRCDCTYISLEHEANCATNSQKCIDANLSPMLGQNAICKHYDKTTGGGGGRRRQAAAGGGGGRRRRRRRQRWRGQRPRWPLRVAAAAPPRRPPASRGMCSRISTWDEDANRIDNKQSISSRPDDPRAPQTIRSRLTLHTPSSGKWGELQRPACEGVWATGALAGLFQESEDLTANRQGARLERVSASAPSNATRR